jgi:hypothetical protein
VRETHQAQDETYQRKMLWCVSHTLLQEPRTKLPLFQLWISEFFWNSVLGIWDLENTPPQTWTKQAWL